MNIEVDSGIHVVGLLSTKFIHELVNELCPWYVGYVDTKIKAHCLLKNIL